MRAQGEALRAAAELRAIQAELNQIPTDPNAQLAADALARMRGVQSAETQQIAQPLPPALPEAGQQ